MSEKSSTFAGDFRRKILQKQSKISPKHIMVSEIVPYNPGEDSVVIYRTDDNSIQLQVKLEHESVWLTQDQMAQLFDRDRTVIGRHIRNIFAEGELDESLVCAKFALPKKYGRHEGLTQDVETTIYNLDVIISVGYRLKSKRVSDKPLIYKVDMTGLK